MELISTHLSADFDAVASTVAARRLYPEAEIFFPGSKEQRVRRFLDTGLLPLTSLRKRRIEPDRLERVILVDARQRPRLGVVGQWLEERPEVPVVAYDHHPNAPGADIPHGDGIVDLTVGCTATILLEEMDRRDLVPTPAEATVLLLGIHDDTGSFTYKGTSARDHAAAARLLEAGADLDAVRHFTRHLDPEHLGILQRMSEDLTVFRIGDQRVGLVALELGEYVPELAPLVSRVLRIFDLPALFALFGEGDRVSIIGRSREERVDVGVLLADFAGGGGHPVAASARVKDQTTVEVREGLLEFLSGRLPAPRPVREVMSTTFYRLPRETTVEAAKERLLEHRVNAAPVMGDDGRPLGGVTRHLLDAAVQHGMAEKSVERVMTRDLVWARPEDPARRLAEGILARRVRFVLVGDEETGAVEGLVTRMDVLRHLYGRLTELEGAVREVPLQGGPHLRELGKGLRRGLAPEVWRRVEGAMDVSRALNVPVYLVGGLVRDLFLERESRDLDLVVQGDGLAFARALAERLGGRAHLHEPFLTAVVVDGEGFHVDVATARSEFYREPAALPEVRSSTLRQDLYRRDFTVNTMAIRVGPDPVPTLVDHFGGSQDLEHGILRVLHSLSFVDDPTRALRAVRLEHRLGMRMSAETEELVRVALEEGVFDRLSGARLRQELTRLLEEPEDALPALERLGDLGLLAALHPNLAWTPELAEHLGEVHAAWDWFRLEDLDLPVSPARLYLLALARDLGDDAARRDLADRLLLAGDQRHRWISVAERLAGARAVLERDRLSPSAAHRTMAPLDGEELLLLLADGDETVRGWVRRETSEMRGFELGIGGRDLVRRGVEPGPVIGRVLDATRDARLDGEIEEGEELEYALRWLQQTGDGVLAGAAEGVR